MMYKKIRNSFDVELKEFEGPLDLMLHLIDINKLDIFDLDLNILTKQYLTYINSMQEKSLEIASEYLYELALLLEHKSRKLLPIEKHNNLELEEDLNPENNLVERLLIYNEFKKLSNLLREKFMLRSKMLDKRASYLLDLLIEEKQYSHQGNDLKKAYLKMLARNKLINIPSIVYNNSQLDYAIVQEQVSEKLSRIDGIISFKEFCDSNNLEEIVLQFIVLLEFSRHGKVFLNMRDNKLYLGGK